MEAKIKFSMDWMHICIFKIMDENFINNLTLKSESLYREVFITNKTVHTPCLFGCLSTIWPQNAVVGFLLLLGSLGSNIHVALNWLQTSLPLTTLPLHRLITACRFRVVALSGHAALAFSPSDIALKLNRSQLSAICCCGQSGKVIDWLAWRCSPLGTKTTIKAAMQPASG